MNYLYIDNKQVVPILSLIPARTPQKIVNHAIDGAVYVHVIGPGRLTADVNVLASTKEERDAMDDAACNGNRISCEFNGQTHIGYIEEGITWRTFRDGWRGVGAFRLLVDVV